MLSESGRKVEGCPKRTIFVYLIEWFWESYVCIFQSVQKRGALIIEKRKLSSAMSASKAACDHIKDWHWGTKPGEWVSMAVPSDGSYGIEQGLIFSFPVTICPKTKEWKIVQGLELDDFAKAKIAATTKVRGSQNRVAIVENCLRWNFLKWLIFC